MFASTAPVSADDARDQPHFGDDRPPSRWATVMAGLGVLAVVVAGVVAAEQWNERPDATPTPAPETTVAPDDLLTSTRSGELSGADAGPPGSPVPATGSPRPSAGVDRDRPWLLTSPAGFTPVSSFVQPHRSPPGWFELWAAPRSARTSGSWLAVQVAQGSRPVLVADAERLTYDDGVLLRWTAPDGVVQLQFSPTSGYDVRITAYGWDPGELLELAASMEIVDGRPAADSLPVGPDDELIVARQSAAFGLEQEYLGGEPWSSAEWRDEDGGQLAITAAPAERDASTIGRFILTASTETAMSGPTVRRNVGTLNATVGRLPGLDGRNAVRWAIGDTALSITGDLKIGDLLDLAATVRPVTDTDWSKFQHTVGESLSATEWTALADGELSGGGTWSVTANGRDDRVGVTIGPLETIIELPTGVFRTYATQHGQLVMSTALLPVGVDVIGAILVEDLGPFTAEVVDASGRSMFSLGDPS